MVATGIGSLFGGAGVTAASTAAGAIGTSVTGGAFAAGAAGATTAATTAAGYSALATAGTLGASMLAQKAMMPRPNISIPPPPGAAMVDQASSMATARIRRQQAIAGGYGSTVSAGADRSTAQQYQQATGGGKTLLGQ
jgi:hypothetical protein